MTGELSPTAALLDALRDAHDDRAVMALPVPIAPGVTKPLGDCGPDDLDAARGVFLADLARSTLDADGLAAVRMDVRVIRRPSARPEPT